MSLEYQYSDVGKANGKQKILDSYETDEDELVSIHGCHSHEIINLAQR